MSPPLIVGLNPHNLLSTGLPQPIEQTPSPYRFLPSSSNSNSNPNNPAPKSTPQSLRPPNQKFQTPIQQIPQSQQQQFASTPRFSISLRGFDIESGPDDFTSLPSFSSSPLRAKRQIRHAPHLAPKEEIEADSDESSGEQEDGSRQNVGRARSSSSPPLVLTSLGRLLHESAPQLRQPSYARKEDIEETACENGASVGPQRAIFGAALNHENRELVEFDLALSPIRKRRRFKSPTELNIYPEAIILSPLPSPSRSTHNPVTDLSDDELQTPPPSVYPTSTAPPHFLTANHGNVSTMTSITSFRKFILPSPSSPPRPGLPQFSPHRRNQKLVPGGLATTLRDLVVQTSLRQQQSQIRQVTRNINAVREGARVTEEKGRSWDFLIPVLEVRRAAEIGTGITLVREKTPDDGQGQRGTKGWVLIGTGVAGNDNISHTDVQLREGSLMGMRLPVWNIEVLGENWWVGVEWGVIS